MNKLLIIVLISGFLFGCRDSDHSSSSYDSYEKTSNAYKNNSTYKNVSGGKSKHISACEGCGISYTVKSLPYGNGSYCSKECCIMMGKCGF